MFVNPLVTQDLGTCIGKDPSQDNPTQGTAWENPYLSSIREIHLQKMLGKIPTQKSNWGGSQLRKVIREDSNLENDWGRS